MNITLGHKSQHRASKQNALPKLNGYHSGLMGVCISPHDKFQRWRGM